MASPQVTGWTGSTDSSLLQRARERRPYAWDQLVELYGPLVYGWCRWARLQSADAADVVQEVFVAVADGLARFDHQDTGSFRAWLRSITGHKTCDHLRRRRRSPESPGGGSDDALFQRWPSPDEVLPEEPAPFLARAALLQSAIERLRGEIQENTWQAFWRTTIDEQSPSEVAVALGMRPGAVYQARSRTMARLREIVAELETPNPPR